MWKIQIFIFVEAILLTLAALTILSVDFSRFIVLMVLFFATFVLLFWQTQSKFPTDCTKCAPIFYRHAQSICDCSHFICGNLWLIDCLSLYVQGK